MKLTASRWRRIRRGFYVSIVSGVLVFGITTWMIGGALIAPANQKVGPPPDDLPFQSTTLQSESGSSIATWYLPSPRLDATVVLLHGIRGNRNSMLEHARMLYTAGYGILMIDLQAHGESPGDHITIGWLESHDVRAAVAYARLKNPNHRVAVLGRSLGGAAALYAADVKYDALVAESVYPTLCEAVHNRVTMRARMFGGVLTRALLCQMKPRLGVAPETLCPIDYVDNVACPLLILCGNLDEHTTVAESLRMFIAADEPKKMVVFENARHEDLLEHDREKYQSQVLSFLNRHLQSQSSLQ